MATPELTSQEEQSAMAQLDQEGFPNNPDLKVGHYFPEKEKFPLALIYYYPDVYQRLLAEGIIPPEKDEELKAKFQFYNRAPLTATDDPRPIGRLEKLIGPGKEEAGYLDYPGNVGAVPKFDPLFGPKRSTIDREQERVYTDPTLEPKRQLQERGFSAYKEWEDPEDKWWGGVDYDSVRYLRKYTSRNLTPRSVKQLFKAAGTSTKARWADPSKPELGIMIKPEGTEEWVSFDLPYATGRDIPEAIAVEGPAMIGELLALRYGPQSSMTTLKSMSGPSKLLEWGKQSATVGFGAAVGDLLRLSYGATIGANDMTAKEILYESGISGLISMGGVATIDLIARGIPLIAAAFKGKMISNDVLGSIEIQLEKARASAAGISARQTIPGVKGTETDTALGPEVTVKDIQDAVKKILPDAEYTLKKNSQLTLGPATLDDYVNDLEVVFLKNAQNENLRKTFQAVLRGEEGLMNDFLNELNRQLGKSIDKDTTASGLSTWLREEGLQDLEVRDAANRVAMDNVLNTLGGTDVAKGGEALLTKVPDEAASTPLFPRDATRIKEIENQYVAPFNEAVKKELANPEYVGITSAGQMKRAATEWGQINKQTNAIFKDFEAKEAEYLMRDMTGDSEKAGMNVLLRLQGRDPTGKYAPKEVIAYTLDELNNARILLNRFASETPNVTARQKARNLERGIERQMNHLLRERASEKSGIALTSKKALDEWIYTNRWGDDLRRAFREQREAIQQTKYKALVGLSQTDPERVVANFMKTNVPGSPLNTQADNLVHILQSTDAPELRTLQDSLIAHIRNKVEIPGATPLKMAQEYRKILKDNEGTLKAFFPEGQFNKFGTWKKFEKNVVNELERSQLEIDELRKLFNSDSYTDIIKGYLDQGATFRRSGEFERNLNFLQDRIKQSPIIQNKTSSIAKAWLVGKIMKRQPGGVWTLDANELRKVLYEGFGPEATGKTFKDFFAPLIGKDGAKYVDNLYILNEMAQRRMARELSETRLADLDLQPQSWYFERAFIPPLTQVGRRITAARNLIGEKAGEFLGNLLLDPAALNTAIKARKFKLNTQAAIRALTALNINAAYDIGSDLAYYDSETKEYRKELPKNPYTRGMDRLNYVFTEEED